MTGQAPPHAPGLPADAGEFLLHAARAAIADRLTLAAGVRRPGDQGATPSWANEPGATFVTLTEDGRLRGCIGSLAAHRPVAEDVHDNALAAAFGDPRFPPLTAAEYPRVRVEVSLLSASEPLEFADEADAVAQLRPGVDGLILTASGRRSTFLPQVWEQLPDPADFLAHLKRKAGLPAAYWGDDVRLSRYTVTAWSQ